MATKTRQQIPFHLGGRGFLSYRLSGEEEILLQEASGVAQIDPAGLPEQFALMAQILTARKMDGEPVDVGWVADVFGPANWGTVTAYLRTGHNGPGLVLRPGETFDLDILELQLGEREFSGPMMNYAEFQKLKTDLDELGLLREVSRLAEYSGADAVLTAAGHVEALLQDGKEAYRRSTRTHYAKADVVAQVLNCRMSDGGAPITGEWLLQEYELSDLETLLNYWLTGEAQAEDPNAEPAPANVPLHG